MMKRSFRNWVKFILCGGLICAGFTACSDDALEGEGMQEQKESTPAYLTLAFTTNGNAESRGSTAEGGYNNGDGDGTAEDSEHYTEGLVTEYAVKTVLVIAAPQDDVNVGFAKLYGVSGGGTVNTDTPGETNPSSNNKMFYVYDESVAGTQTGASPIELAVGNYKILVVVNPPVGEGGLVESGFTSTNNLQEIKDLYEAVEDKAYNPGATIYADYLNGKLRDGGAMMANKVLDEAGPANVTLTAENTPENPKRAIVEVERAISKITYRDLSENNDFKYPITIETDVEATFVTGIVKDENGKTVVNGTKYTILDKLYLAKDMKGDTYSILYTEATDGTQSMKAYKRTDNKVVVGIGESAVEYHLCEPVEFVSSKDEEGCYVADVNNPAGSLEFIYDAANATRQQYYVTIQGYALVNVAKTVNYVRHTVGYKDSDAGIPWGSVAQKYLWTPGWKEKNAETYNAGFGDKYFYNTLANVSEESKVMTITDGSKFMRGGVEATYFKPMNALITNSSTNVSGNEHNDFGILDADKYKETGLTMGYCLENSVDIDSQVNGLVTGISFVATVEDADGEPAQLYRYNGYTYVSLEDIQKAYGKYQFALTSEADNAKGSTFDELVKAPDTATKEVLKENWNIVKYESNVCYYYTTEIKHFDNGNANPGYMEFAIMRNNIYSMAIKGIRSVGDPYIDPTPDIPAESGKSALDVEVKIVPWIVRFNDIEF